MRHIVVDVPHDRSGADSASPRSTQPWQRCAESGLLRAAGMAVGLNLCKLQRSKPTVLTSFQLLPAPDSPALADKLSEANAVLGGDRLRRLLANHDAGRVGI